MKKILAGVLAAASMLSVSATAFADDPVPTTSAVQGAAPAAGISYDVSADVSYGSVDCVLPATSLLAKTSVVVNPYGAAVKTPDETDPDTTIATNTNFIASPYYTIKNNDKESGLKVIATVSVKKATGLVIVDGKAKMPVGWDVAKDKSGTAIDRAAEGYTTYNPLVSYDKVAVKYKDDKVTVDTATGGAKSAKQAMNTAVWLVGGTTLADIAEGEAKYADTTNDVPAIGDTFRVDFAAKGTTGGTIVWLDKAASASNPKVGYFTVMGDLNPEIDRENYSWGKENLSLSIVLKLVPTVVPAP